LIASIQCLKQEGVCTILVLESRAGVKKTPMNDRDDSWRLTCFQAIYASFLKVGMGDRIMDALLVALTVPC
jgi:hypothetical protein